MESACIGQRREDIWRRRIISHFRANKVKGQEKKRDMILCSIGKAMICVSKTGYSDLIPRKPTITYYVKWSVLCQRTRKCHSKLICPYWMPNLLFLKLKKKRCALVLSWQDHWKGTLLTRWIEVPVFIANSPLIHKHVADSLFCLFSVLMWRK